MLDDRHNRRVKPILVHFRARACLSDHFTSFLVCKFRSISVIDSKFHNILIVFIPMINCCIHFLHLRKKNEISNVKCDLFENGSDIGKKLMIVCNNIWSITCCTETVFQSLIADVLQRHIRRQCNVG